jgi:hypothetical protein
MVEPRDNGGGRKKKMEQETGQLSRWKEERVLRRRM